MSRHINNTYSSFSNGFRPIFDLGDANSTSIFTNTVMPIVNALLDVIAIALCSFFILLLYQVHPFHRNLSILLGNMAVAFLIFAVSDSCLSLHYYVSNIYYSNGICWLINTGWTDAQFVVAMTPFTIVIERAVATFNAKTYEIKNSGKFGIALVVAQWGIVLGISVLHQAFHSESEATCYDIGSLDGIFLLIALFILITCNIAGIPAVIALIRINKKQYAATFIKKSHSLSERYQLAENIKTTRFIMPTTTLNSIFALIGVILVLFGVTLENPPKIIFVISDWLFSSLLPLYGVLYPLVCAFAHPALRKQIKRKYFFCCKGSLVSPIQCELRNPNGKALIIDAEKEGDFYFAGLQSAWN